MLVNSARSLLRVSEENDVVLDAAALPTGFDYVALGHVHKPQRLRGLTHVRYAGSLDWGSAAAWGYVAFLVLVTATAAAGVRLTSGSRP